ncbi:VOC family protein [Thalassobacillus hwangdonensis]|uniref:VOC family protein n=1 Tax=Thalassobacillus hwangdonensis TaxID=546108 RepID=A0ABW3L491_9BACI
MHSPVRNEIHTIFVHVSDLKSSVKWYSELLGQEYDLETVTDPVYNLSINHHTGLTLDAGSETEEKQVTPSKYPLFNFHTDDIQEAYTFAEDQGYTIESGITNFEDFSFFTILDPDGHCIMICTG